MRYGGIGSTAILDAIGRRYCTEIPYAKEIADIVDEEGIEYPLRWLLPALKTIARISPNIFVEAALLEGRYLTVNKAIKQFKEEKGEISVLEIAVGLSPRSLNLAEKDRLYMETDLEGMIRLKERVVRKIRKGKEGFQKHLFFQLSALVPSDWEKAGKEYRALGEGKPLLVVIEGLMRHLNRDEQIILGSNVKYFLKKYCPYGACVTADLNIKPEKEQNWILELLSRRVRKETKREFTYFRNEEEIRAFIRGLGLRGEKIVDDWGMENMTCVEKMGFDRELIKEVIRAFPAYLLKVEE